MAMRIFAEGRGRRCLVESLELVELVVVAVLACQKPVPVSCSMTVASGT